MTRRLPWWLSSQTSPRVRRVRWWLRWGHNDTSLMHPREVLVRPADLITYSKWIYDK